MAEYLRHEAAVDDASMRLGEAEELYGPPPRPLWHPFHAKGGYRTVYAVPEKVLTVLEDSSKNIAYLKDLIAKEFEPDDDPNVH